MKLQKLLNAAGTRGAWAIVGLATMFAGINDAVGQQTSGLGPSSVCPPSMMPQWCPPSTNSWIPYPAMSMPGAPPYFQPTPNAAQSLRPTPYGMNPAAPPFQNQLPSQQPSNSTATPTTPGDSRSGASAAPTPTPNQTQSPANSNQQSVQNAIAQSQGNDPSNVVQAAMQNSAGRADGGYDAAGYGRGSQIPANSIGDFFGGRLRSRKAMLAVPGQEFLLFRQLVTPPLVPPILPPEGVASSPADLTILDLDQRDYFRGVIVTDPSLTGRVLVPGNSGVPEGSTVNLVDTGRKIGGDVIVHRAEGLISAADVDNFFDTPPGVISVDDAGPFVVETIDLLPGVHPGAGGDFLGRTAANGTSTEDINGNGILDLGEDLNGNGTIDVAPIPFAAEVFGLYRQLIIPSPGDLVGRLKIAENNTPVPQDRFIFDYTFFENVGLHANGNDVQRFVPGFEKTLFGGLASIDFRMPFASTLDSTIYTSDTLTTLLPGLTNTNSLELGDLSFAGKVLLAQDDNWALSAGAQVTLPTAEDVRLHLTDALQTELLRIENKSIHVMPFLAMQHTPNERLFMQYYAQYDMETRGSELTYRGAPAGTLEDVDFVYLDATIGYWMYSKPPHVDVIRHGNRINTRMVGSRGLTGFAPRAELHYNRSIDPVKASSHGTELQIAGADDELEALNITLGATLQFGADRNLTVAWGAPILNRSDSDFDNELRVTFNWLLPK